MNANSQSCYTADKSDIAEILFTILQAQNNCSLHFLCSTYQKMLQLGILYLHEMYILVLQISDTVSFLKTTRFTENIQWV